MDAEGQQLGIDGPVSLPLESLRRVFKVGDCVQVNHGIELGRHGFVTNVDGPVLTFSDYYLLDNETSQFASNFILSSLASSPNVCVTLIFPTILPLNMLSN